MSKRYDVASPRDYTDRNGEKKTSWINLGVGFEKDGRISILLNALPMPGPDGQAKIVLMEPKPAEDRPRDANYSAGNRAPATRSRDLDDDVPF